MSDALCGPSNALQNFKNHASVDRTLQQDRLTARQSPAQVSGWQISHYLKLMIDQQGFRSQNPREGILDHEFAAFEANLAGPAVPELQHPAHFGPPAARIPAPHQPGNADWASDFQNMQISGPAHHVPHLQHMSPSPAIAGGWQTEFMGQQQRQPPAHAQQAPGMNRAFQPAFAPSYPMQSTSMMQPQQQRQEHHAPAEKFDESAFEAAFEQAGADMDIELQTNATETVQDSNRETAEENADPVVHEAIRIGSDTIPQADKGRGADELARTAGELLDRVQHDQSQKFQQSNFLALMRRIRDREVQVEGDEFREVSTNP